jgi:predicted ATP-binding protein involved in virulence
MGKPSLTESELEDPTASLFSDQADLRNPEEWLVRLDYAAAKPSDVQAQAKKRLSQVKELLIGIMPEDEIEDIRFTTQSGTNPASRAEFKTPYGWVPLRQLGYGYQTLITWVADLANRMVERYPESPDPFAEPAVVLVDEIDLHLHPQWQRKLLGYLTERFPNTQFIATAHSPLVVQAAADANLAVLRREGDHVVIDNDVDKIRGWRVDQILTSDLFGLPTARPPQVEALLLERNKLLDKRKLTAADQRRLQEIEAEIGDLPFGETAQERKERQDIRETLELLKKRLPS